MFLKKIPIHILKPFRFCTHSDFHLRPVLYFSFLFTRSVWLDLFGTRAEPLIQSLSAFQDGSFGL